MFGRQVCRGRSIALPAMLAGCVLILSGCGNFFSKTTSSSSSSNSVASYAYVGTQAGSLGSFSVSSAGGFTALSGSPLQLSTSSINALTVTPGNGFLYAAVAGVGVYGLSINSSTGVPSLISTNVLVQDVSPVAMAVDPGGSYLLVAGLYNGNAAVGEYQIKSDGTLSEVTGSPITITLPSGSSTSNLSVGSIAVAPNSSYVFVSLGKLGVAPLPFTTGGSLSANSLVINAKTSTGTGTTVSNQDLGLAVNSSSTFVYVGETNVGVRVFSIASSFPEVSGSPFSAGGQPRAIAFDSSGGYLYVANATDSTISGFTVLASGGLTALSGSPYSAVGSEPYALSLDQSKKFLLVPNLGGSPDVQLFSFDGTTSGKLDAGATITGLSSAAVVATTH